MALRPYEKLGTRRIRRVIARAGVTCVAVLFVAGCQNDKNHGVGGRVIHGERFPADGAKRSVDRFIEVQSAAAARVDGTLTSAHFDGDGGVNALGRQKLDLMLRDDGADTSPLVVYLDIRHNGGAGSKATGPVSLARHEEAVRAYLADQGLDPNHVELHAGPNLQYTSPAEDGLRGLRRLEGQDPPSSGATGGEAHNPAARSLGELFPGGDK